MSSRFALILLLLLSPSSVLAQDKQEEPKKEEYAIYLRSGAELEWKRSPGKPAQLKVKKLDKKSEAAGAGYQKGDEIIAIGSEAPGEMKLTEYLALADGKATFRVRRKKEELELPALFRAGPMLESPFDRFKPGKQAPPIKIRLPEKGTQDLMERATGRVVLVNFWATWCEPCMKEMPILVRLNQQLQSEGLVVIGVNVDSETSAAEEWLKQNPVPFAVVYTGGFSAEIPADYEVRSIPTNVLVDREHYVVQVAVGFGGASERRLHDSLETILQSEQPIISLCRK